MSSLFEHQIHQNTIYTSNGRYSIHINKNSSIGLKTFFTVWFRNNQRRSACTTKPWYPRRSPMLVMFRPMTSLGHQEGQTVFREGPKFLDYIFYF